MYVFLAQAAIIHLAVGIIVEWSIPNLFWGFGFYVDALAAMAVGFAAPLMPVLGFLGSRLVRVRAAAAPSAQGVAA
jgi:hypothetical protein